MVLLRERAISTLLGTANKVPLIELTGEVDQICDHMYRSPDVLH